MDIYSMEIFKSNNTEEKTKLLISMLRVFDKSCETSYLALKSALDILRLSSSSETEDNENSTIAYLEYLLNIFLNLNQGNYYEALNQMIYMCNSVDLFNFKIKNATIDLLERFLEA